MTASRGKVGLITPPTFAKKYQLWIKFRLLPSVCDSTLFTRRQNIKKSFRKTSEAVITQKLFTLKKCEKKKIKASIYKVTRKKDVSRNKVKKKMSVSCMKYFVSCKSEEVRILHMRFHYLLLLFTCHFSCTAVYLFNP